MAPKKGLVLLGLSLLLTACGGGGGGGGSSSNVGGGGNTNTDPCGTAAQIDFVETVANDYYYWYDELAQVNKSDYSDASDYLAAIMRPIWCDQEDTPGNCVSSGRDPGFSYLTTIEYPFSA